MNHIKLISWLVTYKQRTSRKCKLQNDCSAARQEHMISLPFNSFHVERTRSNEETVDSIHFLTTRSYAVSDPDIRIWWIQMSWYLVVWDWGLGVAECVKGYWQLRSNLTSFALSPVQQVIDGGSESFCLFLTGEVQTYLTGLQRKNRWLKSLIFIKLFNMLVS